MACISVENAGRHQGRMGFSCFSIKRCLTSSQEHPEDEVRLLPDEFSYEDVLFQAKALCRSRKQGMKKRRNSQQAKENDRKQNERRSQRKKNRCKQLLSVTDVYEKIYKKNPRGLLHPEFMSDTETDYEDELPSPSAEGSSDDPPIDPALQLTVRTKVLKVITPAYCSKEVSCHRECRIERHSFVHSSRSFWTRCT